MSASSGQYVTTTPRTVTCTGMSRHVFAKGTPDEFTREWECTFEGVEDIDVDPENQSAEWVCPACGTHHEIEWAELVGGAE